MLLRSLSCVIVPRDVDTVRRMVPKTGDRLIGSGPIWACLCGDGGGQHGLQLHKESTMGRSGSGKRPFSAIIADTAKQAVSKQQGAGDAKSNVMSTVASSLTDRKDTSTVTSAAKTTVKRRGAVTAGTSTGGTEGSTRSGISLVGNQ